MGDGSIRFPNLARDGKISGNARYEMTMSSKVVDYIQHLFETIYPRLKAKGGQFSKTGLKGWPNTDLPKHAGKVVSQYYCRKAEYSISSYIYVSSPSLVCLRSCF